MSKPHKLILLDALPTIGKGYIDWEKSVGHSVYFEYEDLKGYLEILDFKTRPKLSSMITIKYEDKVWEISTPNLKGCKLGTMLNYFTLDYRYNIGDEFLSKDKERFIIIDRKKVRDDSGIYRKRYTYKCVVCGAELERSEDAIKVLKCCPACHHNLNHTVAGVNDIPSAAPWMVKYFPGGEDEARKYVYSSTVKVDLRCPICGKIINKKLTDLYKRHSLGCLCDRQYTMPERIMANLLESTNIEYVMQLTSSHFSWIGSKRYDFYLPTLNCIIETHGALHYHDSTLTERTLEEELENDRYKKELAINNGITNYFEIDCCESLAEYILDSSEKAGLLEFLGIDKSKVDVEHLYLNKNDGLIDRVKEYITNNPNAYYTNISVDLNISNNGLLKTILKNIEYKCPKKNLYKIQVFDNGELLETYDSFSAFNLETRGKEYHIGTLICLRKYVEQKLTLKDKYTYLIIN